MSFDLAVRCKDTSAGTARETYLRFCEGRIEDEADAHEAA